MVQFRNQVDAGDGYAPVLSSSAPVRDGEIARIDACRLIFTAGGRFRE
jgi:hypothetical protein